MICVGELLAWIIVDTTVLEVEEVPTKAILMDFRGMSTRLERVLESVGGCCKKGSDVPECGSGVTVGGSVLGLRGQISKHTF